MEHKEHLEYESTASNPGGLTLSYQKLRLIEPSMFGIRNVLRKVGGGLVGMGLIETVDVAHLREHLAAGDCRAAVVISIAPLLVAAYSDDLDCVAMLRFRDEFARRYRLAVGARLLTINTYYSQFTSQADLTFGPNHTGELTGFFPLIAEFLSDDERLIEQRKSEIDDDEWRRCQELGDAYRLERPGVARDGRPRMALRSAGFVKQVVIGTAIGIVGIAAFVILAWMFL